MTDLCLDSLRLCKVIVDTYSGGTVPQKGQAILYKCIEYQIVLSTGSDRIGSADLRVVVVSSVFGVVVES